MKNKAIMFLLFAIAIMLTNCKKEEENNLKGLTFTLLSEEPSYSSSIRLGEINIVNYNEIMGYDSTQFTFLLDDKAKERILEYKTSSFAVAVDGVIVYFASFIPGYISQSCHECIRIEPYSLDNKYSVELGYPGGTEFPYEDPRNDKKILNILERDGKLIELEQ